jgi:hypothetical protein
VTSPEELSHKVMEAVQPPMTLEDAVEFIEQLQEMLSETLSLLRADLDRQDTRV